MEVLVFLFILISAAYAVACIMLFMFRMLFGKDYFVTIDWHYYGLSGLKNQYAVRAFSEAMAMSLAMKEFANYKTAANELIIDSVKAMEVR